jgi:hypothetical protein
MTPLADQLQGFPRNTRWYAAHWIVSGERHPQEHWYISERLAKWRQQAADRREELQATAQSILAKFDRECTAEARPARVRVMPSGRVTGLGPETDLAGDALAGADKIDAGAHAAVAGERKDLPRYHSTPRGTECAQAIEVPRENLISQMRAYRRRAVTRGTGRWAQKRLRRDAA